MKNIELTDLQVIFLEKAIELKNHILPLHKETMSATDFKNNYGFSKKQMEDSIYFLKNIVSEPTTKSNTSEKANELIPDVSDMFSFGDIVEAKCTATGRYIGKGKCVYISAMTNERCVDNVKEKCENTYDLPVVDDNELENYR